MIYKNKQKKSIRKYREMLFEWRKRPIKRLINRKPWIWHWI